MTSIDAEAAVSPEETDHIPLSFNQDFLCMFDQGDDRGPFGPRYSIVYGWRVRGAIDVEVLGEALFRVVRRHEALRTVVVRDEQDRHQRVLPASPPRLRVLDLRHVDPADRDRRAEELLIELEAGDYPVSDLPLVQVVLAQFSDDDAVLVLTAHHTAVDGWSMHVLIQDLAVSYGAARGQDVPDLVEPAQYREYVAWERQRASDSAATARSRDYWRKKLQGAEILGLRTDWPKSAGRPKDTAAHRFLVDPDVTSAALGLAKDTRSSAFMVMLAAYKVFLRDATGATDIVVPTLASNRGEARFQQTVGSFFNFIPLRTDLSGCSTFREVLKRTRAACLEAYAHQIPFAQVMADSPNLGRTFMADDLAVYPFQVFQFPYVMSGELIGDLEFSEIRRRLLPQDVGPEVPDGALWTLDLDSANHDLVGCLQYNTNVIRGESANELVLAYLRVLRRAVLAPDAQL
jgi:condensation enzyme